LMTIPSNRRRKAMKRLPVIGHLSPAEIARRYRACPDGAEKTRWQIIWLITRPDQPMSAGRAALSVGLTASWGRTLLKRWNESGPDGLADGRKDNGAEPVLTADQQADLYAALQADPPDGGLWTGPKVARYVHDRWGVEVVPQTGWRWLVGLGFSLRVPRPRHPKAATAEEQRVWL
jgi:transposase